MMSMVTGPIISMFMPCILCTACIYIVIFHPYLIGAAFSYVPWLCGMIPWEWIGLFFKNFFQAVPGLFGMVADVIEKVIGDIF